MIDRLSAGDPHEYSRCIRSGCGQAQRGSLPGLGAAACCSGLGLAGRGDEPDGAGARFIEHGDVRLRLLSARFSRVAQLPQGNADNDPDCPVGYGAGDCLLHSAGHSLRREHHPVVDSLAAAALHGCVSFDQRNGLRHAVCGRRRSRAFRRGAGVVDQHHRRAGQTVCRGR